VCDYAQLNACCWYRYCWVHSARISFAGIGALCVSTYFKANSNNLMLIRFGNSLFRFLASLKLAVASLVILATVLSCATILETQHGARYARWYVYEATWFVVLLGLLGVNIFCAAAIRFPWKRYQTGFVITHAGLLVLLFGSILTFVSGVEGRITLAEGESTQSMALARRSQINAHWVGRPQEPPYEFSFDAGPVEWPLGKSLNIGAVDGVQARILRYLDHPHAVESWVLDESKSGGPAVRFKVVGKDGVTVAESWLVDQQFGDAVLLGPLRLQLERAVTDEVVKDFLNPPVEDLGEKGVLVMYFGDEAKRVPIDHSIGNKIPLGQDGVAVEIAAYLANATPDKLGNFTSKDEQPKNPMVELRVHLPGVDKPLRQIAFAKDYLLNLDGVYAQVCPVKFRFHHPTVQPKSGLELLQTSDGTLYGRMFWGGKYQSQGEVKPGDRINTAGNFQLQIVQHLRHSAQKVEFETDASVSDRKAKLKSEPAALVEISAGGAVQQIWLRRNDPNYGRRNLVTPNGSMALSYENARIPLGFSLKLIDFRREKNPGNAGNAGFSSCVRAVDPMVNMDEERTISMNEPLTHGKFTFYQSGFDDAVMGRETSTFSVAYDPGRVLKYSGSLMICLGIAVMFYMRAYFFRQNKTAVRDGPTIQQRLPDEADHQKTELESAA
jgi:hypothetical protein